MSSIGDITSSYYDLNSIYGNIYGNASATGTASAEKLTDTLGNIDVQNSSDEELLEACRSFESYFVEQVLKEAKKMVKDEEEENDYLQYFGDTMIQEYASMITERGDLGLARTLYDSMKRNGL